MLSRYNGLDSIILCINAGPGCNVSENLIHNGVVVESYCEILCSRTIFQ